MPERGQNDPIFEARVKAIYDRIITPMGRPLPVDPVVIDSLIRLTLRYERDLKELADA